MDSLITVSVAKNYDCKVSKQKVTVDSISIFINNKGTNNFDNDATLETLKEM